MPEEQEQEKSEPVKVNYYTDTRRKVIDFFIGFLGCPVLMWLAIAAGTIQGGGRSSDAGVAVAVILTLVFIGFSIHRGRKYISIGVASLFLFPILVVGSCLLVAGGRF